jgi:hypothetical protein
MEGCINAFWVPGAGKGLRALILACLPLSTRACLNAQRWDWSSNSQSWLNKRDVGAPSSCGKMLGWAGLSMAWSKCVSTLPDPACPLPSSPSCPLQESQAAERGAAAAGHGRLHRQQRCVSASRITSPPPLLLSPNVSPCQPVCRGLVLGHPLIALTPTLVASHKPSHPDRHPCLNAAHAPLAPLCSCQLSPARPTS